MKVSVLINNYNHEKFIADAINSLLSQTYQDFEIIVYDDLSTDNSLNILKEFKDKVKIIENKEKGKIGNFNQMKAIKTAFEHSVGEYICLLDGDDTFCSTKLEKVVSSFNDLDVVMVQNVMRRVDSDLKPLNIKYNNFVFVEDFKEYIKNNKSISSLFSPTSGLSFRRDFFEKVIDLIFEKSEILVWADLRLSYHAVFNGKIKTITEPLTNYRIHSNNFIHLFNDREKYIEHINQAKTYFERVSLMYDEKLEILGYPEMFMNSPFIKTYMRNDLLEDIPREQEIIIWGAGEAGQAYCQYLLHNDYNIRCFIEGNPKLQGKDVFNYEVFSSEILKEYENDTLLLSPYYAAEIIYENLHLDFPNFKGEIIIPYKR